MMSNLIQEVNVKMYVYSVYLCVYVLLNMILQQHSTLKTITACNTFFES